MIRVALIASVLACVALPAAAQASDGTGTLTLGGAADAQLRAAGVRFAALAPATRSGRAVTLTAKARTAAPVRLTLRGGLRLRTRGGRAVSLTSLRVELGALPTLSARVRGKRRTIANVQLGKRGVTIDAAADELRLDGARVVLTRRGGALLKQRLGLRRRPAGRLATLAALAAPQLAPQPGPGTPDTPGTTPGSTEPVPLARPATAVDITGAQVTWHVRDSFIRYIATGEGTSAHDGAVAGPAVVTEESDVPLVYEYGFPFASGWFDPVGGAAAVNFTGRVRFSYSAHGIELDAEAPELELNGTGSRAVMRIDGRREVLVNLRLDQAKAITVDGATRTYEQVPGEIPQGTGDSVFAGFYLTGDPFGWFTVSFAT